jgi:hypothetical protein
MAQLLSPTELINNLLASAPLLQRQSVLTRAKQANEQMLKQLADERLQVEESGWLDHWQTRHTRTTETLAAIEQALATC